MYITCTKGAWHIQYTQSDVHCIQYAVGHIQCRNGILVGGGLLEDGGSGLLFQPTSRGELFDGWWAYSKRGLIGGFYGM